MGAEGEPTGGRPEPRLAKAGTDLERRLLDASRFGEGPAHAIRRRVVDRVLAGRTPRRIARQRRTWLGAALAALGVGGAIGHGAMGERRTRGDEQLSLSAEPIAAQHDTAVRPPSVAQPRTPCTRVMIGAGLDGRIDDFEDQNANLLPLEQRQGTWRIVTDGTGTLSQPRLVHAPAKGESPEFWAGTWHPEMVPRGHDHSRFALHTRGGKFTEWGIVGSTTLVLEPGACYDASSYAGLEFWAKGTSRIAVSPTMVDTVPTWDGGLCTSDCYNRHVRQIELTGEWQHYAIEWSELVQYPAPSIAFDPRRLRSLEFIVIAGSTPFEMWLDDVGFLHAIEPAPGAHQGTPH